MNKQNLILLHGALGSKKQLEPLKHILADEFHIYNLNFEGHGGRLSNNEFSIDLFLSNVLDLIHEKGIEGTNIFGYSMGGYVALKLALDHAELVGRIVTLGTKFNWTKESAEKEVRMLNPAKVEEKVPAFARHLQKIHAPCDWKEVMSKTSRMMINMGNGNQLSEDDLRRISAQVLIGIGGLDKMVSVEESRSAAHLLPHGEFMVIEGFQHPFETIDMGRMADILSNFIAKHS
jgi:pimeloyl-ACP methyl ester carboxylesterase